MMHLMHRVLKRRRTCSVALALAATASLLMLAAGANAATFVVHNTTELEAAVTSANGNTEANTIELTHETYLPSKTLIFTNTHGTQTVAGPAGTIGVATPGVTLSGAAVQPDEGVGSEKELITVKTGVTVTLKHVVVTGGGEGGNAGIEDAGTLNVENATISGNIGTQIQVASGATANLTNSTLSDGHAFGLGNEGTASFLNVTVVHNAAGGIGGNAGTLGLTNTIVALNGPTATPQCSNNTITNDHSLASDATCGGGAAFENKTPLLQSSLLNDGGSTTIYSEKAGSPTIAAGDTAKCPATDQRGYPRPAVGKAACDIGADEYSPTPPTITVPANITEEATSPSGKLVTYTVEAADPDALVKKLECAPASGSTFAVGTTTVNCTALDGHENTASKSFTVTIKPEVPKHTLTVTVSGEGTVTSTPAGIECGQSHTKCSAAFAEGEAVSLTPTPAANHLFKEWGSACSGSGSCSVTMSANESVTAEFIVNPAPAPPAGGITIGGGTPHVGETLNIAKGGNASEWTAAEGSLSYQWEDCTEAAAPGPNAHCSSIEGGPEYTLTALDEGKYVRVAVTAHNTSGSMTTAYSVVTAAVVMVHSFPVNVHGEVPYTQTLTSYCTEVNLGHFIPAEARTYTGTCGVTATSTEAKSTLTAEDAGTTHKGYLVHTGTSKEFALDENPEPNPLEVKAADAEEVAGPESALAPLTSIVTLREFLTPISNDAVTLTFSQHIGAHERLNTGLYHKTITITLANKEP